MERYVGGSWLLAAERVFTLPPRTTRIAASLPDTAIQPLPVSIRKNWPYVVGISDDLFPQQPPRLNKHELPYRSFFDKMQNPD